MQDVSQIPVVEQETRLASNGGSYVSKIIYENAYWKVTVWYSEGGGEIKRDEKRLE